MKLWDLLNVAYEGNEQYIEYALKFMEYYCEGNEFLLDGSRDNITHNGSYERDRILTGNEIIDTGIYTVLTFGHDGREFLVKHDSIEDANDYYIEWNPSYNPFSNSCSRPIVVKE